MHLYRCVPSASVEALFIVSSRSYGELNRPGAIHTSAASISTVVAMRMGHADLSSYFAYVSRAMSRRAAQERTKR